MYIVHLRSCHMLIASCTMAVSYVALGMFVLAPFVEGAYIGCVVDSPDRLLTGNRYNDPQLTTDQCFQWCIQQGHAFAGTQYRSHCFCGDDIDLSKLVADDECNMACGGNQSEICGGAWRMSVYSTDIQTTAIQTAAYPETTTADIQTTTSIQTTSDPETTTADIQTTTDKANVTTTLAVQTGNVSCNCKCYKPNWSNSANLTMAQQQKILSKLQALLTVTKRSTSSYKRKFISEYDSRPSSIAMGYIASAVLSLITGIIVVPDIIRFVFYVHKCHGHSRRK